MREAPGLVEAEAAFVAPQLARSSDAGYGPQPGRTPIELAEIAVVTAV